MKYVLTDLEWWFWSSNVGLLAQGLTSRQQKKPVCQISSGQIQDGRHFIGKLQK